ncbi:zinc finger BED domain-containing protein RICESLEEPER 3 [Tanacetum coccineum]
MPFSMFTNLKLTNLKETSTLVEVADMSKKARRGIVKNVIVKINKFIFPSDFVVINMLGEINETMILGRPFLTTIHVRINVFHKEISLGIGDDKILIDMNGNVHHPPNPAKNVCMIKTTQEKESFDLLGISEDLISYDSPLCVEFETYNHVHETDKRNEYTFVGYNDVQIPIVEYIGNIEVDVIDI